MLGTAILASLAAAMASTAPPQPHEDSSERWIIPAEALETFALGQTQRFGSELAVTPVAVVEDSRCPTDVLCVQAGRLVVALRVEQNGAVRTLNVELGIATMLAGGTITLADASERRVSRAAGEAEQPYSFRFTYAPHTA